VSAGAVACAPCPAGTYAATGAATCPACPTGTYATGGAAACSACNCDDLDSCTTDTCDPGAGCRHVRTCDGGASVADATPGDRPAGADGNQGDLAPPAADASDGAPVDASGDAGIADARRDVSASLDTARDVAHDGGNGSASSGCSCRIGVKENPPSGLALVALAALVLAHLRRRGRRRS
jgi:hypothetical protein